LSADAAAISAPDAVVAGIDVGGTGIKAGLVGVDGVVRHELRRPTRVELGPDAVVSAVGVVGDELAAAAATRGETLRGVGIGVPTLTPGSPTTPRISAGTTCLSPGC
jgi:predicted NBD/HSP70 family sugar kinase